MTELACHNCHGPLDADDHIATEMVKPEGARSRVLFCRVRCLEEWAHYIVTEADKHIAEMKAKDN